MNNGAFILARQVFDSEIWQDKPAWWFKVWVYLIGNANHKDKGKYKKGSLLTSVPEVYIACNLKNDNVTETSVKNVFKWLKQTTQITTRKTTRGMWVTVCNYSKYQDLTNYRNSTENSTGTLQELDDKQQFNNETSKKRSNKRKSTKSGEKKKVVKSSSLEQEYNEGVAKKPSFVADAVWHSALIEMLKCKKEGKILPSDKPEWLLNYDPRELMPLAAEVCIDHKDLQTIASELYNYYKGHDFKFAKSGKPIKNFKMLMTNIVRSDIDKFHKRFGVMQWS